MPPADVFNQSIRKVNRRVCREKQKGYKELRKAGIMRK